MVSGGLWWQISSRLPVSFVSNMRSGHCRSVNASNNDSKSGQTATEKAHKEWERGYDDGLAGRPFHLPEGRMGPAILDYSRGYDEGGRVRQRRA